MFEWLENFISPDTYMPHGQCYLWQTGLIWLHAASDALTAIAYYSIPLTLLYFVRKREDVPFRRMFVLFVLFILTCGTTHWMQVWTLWHPAYWLSGLVKASTALASCYAAVELFPIVPQALALPSPRQLRAMNWELERQVSERQLAETRVRQLNWELERRVTDRTAALEREIKERQETEMRLRLFERAIAASSNGIAIVDATRTDYPTIYVNHAFEKITGYSAAETVGKNLRFLQGDETDQPGLDRLRQALQSQEDCTISLRNYRRNGTPFWSELSVAPVFDDAGQATHYVCVQTDVTDRKHTQEALTQANEQLQAWVWDLERRNEEMARLEHASEFLQACLTLEEARESVGDLVAPLFPGCAGAIFFLREERDLLESAAAWGRAPHSDSAFTTADCWALRRGNFHRGDRRRPGLFCQHIRNASGSTPSLPETALCVPMVAQGEALGLLYLESGEAGHLNEGKEQLARTVAERVALLFANLKLRETLRNESIRDALTGLYNRRYLEETLTREIERCKKKEQSLSAIMLDIDRFKGINDTWGHEVGDRVLQALGRFLVDNIRSSDIACRYGGEEFTLILPDTSLDAARSRAEQLRSGVKSLSVPTREGTVGLTISLGLASYPEHGATDDALLRHADDALYRAKKNGRDRLEVARES